MVTYARGLPLFAFALLSLSVPAQTVAAPINFSGPLTVVETDNGAGIYSGVSLGTEFSGVIDDVSASGNISDGVTSTAFGCCIAAGALDPTDDVTIDADFATLGNLLAGSNLFSDGDVVDLIDLEGDVTTASGGRIEVGLSFILASTAFDTAVYPFDPDDLLLSVFFILEEDADGNDIYSGIGRLDSLTLPPGDPDSQIPLPTTAWLLALGCFAAVAGGRRRDHGNAA